MSRWLGSVVLAGAVGLGCGNSTCANLQKAATACGITYDESTCNANLNNCTSSDQEVLNTSADCLDNATVCAGGAEVTLSGAIQCQEPEFKLSAACQKVLGS